MSTDQTAAASLVLKHRRLQLEYGQPFRTTFGVNLGAPFWGNLLGLDLTVFDEQVVHSREDESISDAINRQWGEEGVQLVRALIQG